MMKTFCGILSLALLMLGCGSALAESTPSAHKLLYQGHGSLRIVTAEGKVIYVDPYAGEGYDLPADLILVTHAHSDHNALSLIGNRNEGCQVITYKEALVNGEYKTYDLGFATIEAVQAGNNRNHNIRECVGWVITLSGDISIYATGDTSTTEQMAELAERHIDYAFFVCDGRYNMDMEEAIACAKLVNAKHSIPYHMAPGKLFDQQRAKMFDVPNRLIIPAGEEIELE
jgi:L-ascorbate metabolism protein UlaG (beta-lactamase superfamily)